jgi:DNA-binding CsgD family transcriptional regulator
MRPALCPVLVGRDSEIGLLKAALEAARGGRGCVIFLAGEAGIGKSRLVREISGSAAPQGSSVLTGRAVAGGVPTPFRPFAEALAASLRPGGLPDGTELGPFLPALSRLVPQMRPASAAAGDGSLVFLGEAVLRLLRQQSPAAGCLLVLEDLHWADSETLALVEYLADNLGTERVLCVCTFRAEEGGEAAALAAKLEARGSGSVLTLRSLDDRAVRLMTLACLGSDAPPESALTFVAERAEGIPFLVEELIAGLLDEKVLVERAGRWETTGAAAARVPGSFGDAVDRRLAALDPVSGEVIRAAAVLGRRFDWTLLGATVGISDDAIAGALRAAVGMQLLATVGEEFRFRHALTHEAVLAGLLPPERSRLAGLALSAVEVAHPGLPGAWCTLAAELAERSGSTGRAAELLLEAGRRDRSVGALASAEQALTKARELTGSGATPDDLALRVDEALTEVYAVSGQVDRAIETGQRLLARIGTTSAARSVELHLLIARGALAGGMWAQADASVRIARRLADELGPAEMARVDVCAAQVAVGYENLEEARRLAEAALQAAGQAGLPDVQCEALEVIGRVLRQIDTAEAERAYARAAAIASANGLPVAHVRAQAETAILHMLRTGSLDMIRPARDLAAEHGALYTTVLLDFQIMAIACKEFSADEALAAATRCVSMTRRFHISGLPEALVGQAAAHAIRGERQEMEDGITEAVALAPQDRDVLGSAWGRCRATLSILDEDLDRAWSEMDEGARLMLVTSAGPAAPFLGLWPLLGAVLGRDVAAAAARVRACHLERNRLIAGLLGYADAIAAGRNGGASAAEAAFAVADEQVSRQGMWYWHYARRVTAQAALADGWGDPVSWLRASEAYFAARADDRIADACRRLLRDVGAPVPRRRPADAAVPGRLRALGVTGREADVLGLVADGLTNREIADRMFLSPRTVEKHVASLLAKTGLRRRSQLAGYLAGLDG